jgi:hypothetical protein
LQSTERGKEKKSKKKIRMRLEGWCLLVIFWGLIVGVAVYCFQKIIFKKEIRACA